MRPASATIFDDCATSLGSGGTAALAPLRRSRLVVTGGTGFVGSWLTALVATLNDRFDFDINLTLVARAPRGLAAQLSRHRSDITLVAADVRQLIELPAGTSWLVHAAGNPDNRFHATAPVETASVIVDGTAHLLGLAANAPALRRVLHLSSGLVGAVAAARLSGAAVYAEAKRFSEVLCAAHRTQNRTPVVVTRPFTFIGAFQPLDAPWAINNFLHAAIVGQPLKLLGDGESVRTCLYGSDMAVLLLTQLVKGDVGEVYDLGGTTALTLLELARMIANEARHPLEIRVKTGGRDVGVSRLIPDMSRSGRDLGFVAAFDDLAAIRRTLAWHEAEHRIAAAA